MNPYSQAFKDHVRVYGLDNNLVLRMINTCDELKAEVARLRSALQFIANHTAEPGTALETVAKFAAATLDEVK